MADTSYRGFSCPQEPIDEHLVRSIAIRHYRRALRTFVARHQALLLERGGVELIGLYDSWFDSEASFETVWHIAFGKMREVLARQLPSGMVLASAARTALRLSEVGVAGQWSLQLEGAERFRWGRWLLPNCDHLEVSADETGAALRLSLEGAVQTVRFTRHAEGLSCEGAETLPVFDTGAREIGILMPNTPEGHDYSEHPFEANEASLQAVHGGYRAAFTLLDRYAPVYRPFVNRLLRQLVPVQAAPGAYIGGGSLRDNPGVVKLPFTREPVGLAANLGHESAHQHYFLLRGAGPVDDGSDLNLYYSPFVEEQRDIVSILLTYHAFANEALVARTCELGGVPDPYARERALLVRSTLGPLEDILASSRALTPMGRDLFEPVSEHLRRAYA